MKRRHLSTTQRVKLFEARKGICEHCKGKIMVGEAWDHSHTIPLELGGADDESNWNISHRKCHRHHTASVDVPTIAKAHRREANHIGASAPSRNPIPGGRRTPWKMTFSKGAIRR